MISVQVRGPRGLALAQPPARPGPGKERRETAHEINHSLRKQKGKKNLLFLLLQSLSPVSTPPHRLRSPGGRARGGAHPIPMAWRLVLSKVLPPSADKIPLPFPSVRRRRRRSPPSRELGSAARGAGSACPPPVFAAPSFAGLARVY